MQCGKNNTRSKKQRNYFFISIFSTFLRMYWFIDSFNKFFAKYADFTSTRLVCIV